MKVQTIGATRPRSMALVLQPPENFAAQTADKAMFGLVGLAAMYASGNKIAKENGLVDPSIKLGTHLADVISKKLALTTKVVTQTLTPNPAVTDGIAELWPPVTDVDLVLNVRTAFWGFGYFPENWRRYKFHYHFRVNLTDLRDGSTLAKGDCLSDTKGGYANAPLYDELLANSAEVLKRQIEDAIDLCLDKYESRLFFTAAERRPPASTSPQPASTTPSAY